MQTTREYAGENALPGIGRRVLIIVQNLPVPFDRRVWQEATELVKSGYTVSVICPKGKGYDKSYECLDGVHIYRHPLPFEASGALGYLLEYSSSLFWEFLFALRVFFTRGFDAIHACNPPDNIFIIGAFFKYLFGRKFLFDHHDINPELYEAKFNRRDFFYKVMIWWERLTFHVADVSIATNNSYRQIAIERGHMDPDKVFVVRSGPSLERMKIIPAVTALKQGRRYLVGYVGVMGKQEGIEYLIEAARHIVHDLGRTDIHFALVGGGPALEELKTLAAAKQVGDTMTFTGRAPDQTLLEVLNTADVCVNPDEVNSMNDKSTMNKIMEYMALGKPIVQFDVTEGRYSAGEASLYAQPNNARDLAEKILELLDDPERRRRMGQFGRARVEKELAWNYEAPKLLAAYEALFTRIPARKLLGDRATWYLNRLAAMSPAEILHRIEEAVKRRRDRFFPAKLPAAEDRGAFGEIPGLREGLSAWQVPEAKLAQWEESLVQAKSGNFFLLGRRWPQVTADKKWHLDPVTQTSWPKSAFCFAINYRHAPGRGDIKYVWEINRLQYLQPVAALAFKRHDGELAVYCLSEIEAWIDGNPPYKGINWSSGIELALRAASILFVTSLLGEYLTERQRGKIWASLEAHGYWLARYPSRFSSANNHRTAEGLGLFIIGTLCPALPLATEWKNLGWWMLCESARTQVLTDGAGAEQAIAYHAVVLEMLLLGQHIARGMKIAVPQEYMQRLTLAGEFLRWFTDTGGHQPQIGDDDNARIIGVWRRNEPYIASVLGCIASVTNRADLFPPGNTLQLRCALYGVPQPAAAGPEGVHSFEAAGYTVGRHHPGGRDVLIAMDHGYLGSLSIAAHGHADALAVWLHLDDQPVLADAGTYLYHSGGEWRTHFRGTAAHNTLAIEKTDSSIMAGNFNWSHKARARLTGSEIAAHQWWIEAEHDGYLAAFGLIHRRRLTVKPESGFSIEDMLIGERSVSAEIAFLLHPALNAVQDGEGVLIRKGPKPLLSLQHRGALAPVIGAPGTPEGGWYSESFGEKIPTTRIAFTGTLSPQQRMTTQFTWVER